MLRIKTFYLNVPEEVKSEKKVAYPDTSRIIRFCNHTMATYATIVNKISEVFLNIELGVQYKYIKDPSYISIILPNLSPRKYQSFDPESTLERIYWIVSNLRPTTNGMVISVYINHEEYKLDIIDSHWNLNNLWINNETWQMFPDKGNYVTVQLPEKVGKFWNQEKFYENWEVVKDYLDSKNIETKFISYKTPIEDVYKLLLNTKVHIGYIGSCYFIAALTRTPTIGLGKESAQDPFIKHGRKNCWGNGSMAPNRVLQINPEGKIYNGFVMGSIDTTNTEYIKNLVLEVIENDNYDRFWK
jgi:hypothetical protein